MKNKSKLTVGPILFHWPVDKKRDFYFRIADEAPVDRIYIGEIICGKRAHYFEPYYEEVTQRLLAAGKEVVHSTMSEVVINNDRRIVKGLCELNKTMVEANDVSALWYLKERKHAIGPLLNTYNEWTLTHLVENGASHITLPSELPSEAIANMGVKAKALGVTLEIQVYGRMPLALSARCYHARAHDRIKDNCQYVCEDDPDGMPLNTLTGEPFLAINGIQTLSYTCLNLMNEMTEMESRGISAFRLSPHSNDMVKTAQLFRNTLDQTITAGEASAKLQEQGLNIPFTNGFYYRKDGFIWVDNDRM